MGDIEKAYRIRYSTNINFGNEYKQENKYENKANLKENGSDVNETNAEVIVNRDTLLKKEGVEESDYEKREISWTININKANHNIKNAILKDEFGDGQELIKESIKIFDQYGIEISKKDAKYPKFTETSKGFELSFGDIDSAYRIEYKNKITDTSIKNLTNNAALTGDSLVGEGIENGKTSVEENLSQLDNDYSKKAVTNGLHSQEQRMEWLVTVDARKENITELKLIDSYFPEKSMLLLEDTLKVYKTGNDGKRTLVESEKYELRDKSVEGFELEFKGELERAKYEIEYSTSYEPIAIGEAGGVTIEDIRDREFINNVVFKGKQKDSNGNEKTIDTSKKCFIRIK